MHPARFWVGAALVFFVVAIMGPILRSYIDLPWSAVELWSGFMGVSAVALPIHITWWLRHVAGPKAGQSLRAELGADVVRLHSDTARSLGLASHVGLTRGHGALVMTDEELRFRPGAGHPDVSIAVADIRAIDTTRQHAGEACRREAVRIVFASEDGEDTIAWELEDPGPWLEALRARVPGED